MDMKTTAAVTITAAAALALVGCSSNNEASQPEQDTGSATTSAGAAATTSAGAAAATTAQSTIDKAKLTAFVAAFRTGYSELSRDRSDEDIEKIATESCAQLADGTDRQTVTVQIEALAAHGGTTPTSDQAENIYRLVAAACP